MKGNKKFEKLWEWVHGIIFESETKVKSGG